MLNTHHSRASPARARFDYGLSTFAKSITWTAADTFTLYFLTDVARLKPSQAGLFVFAFLSWNAICDPIIGRTLDRRSGTPSRTYFLITSILAGLLFVVSFTVPPTGWPRGPLLLAAGLAFRTAYSAMDTPHNAMLARLAPQGGAVGLGAMRLVAGTMAVLVISFAAKSTLGQSSSDAPEAFCLYAALLAIVSTLIFTVRLPVADDGPSPSAVPGVAPQARTVAPARLGVLLMFIAAMLATVMTSVFSKDLVFIAKYVFGNAALAVQALVAITLGKLLGAPLWWWASGRFGVIRAMGAAYLVSAIPGLVLGSLSPHWGMFESGMVMLGAGLGGINMLTWAMLPQWSCPASPAKPTMMTQVFGTYTALTKVAAGASGAVLGLLLVSVGLHDGVLAAEGARRFYRVACFVPVAGAAACLLCLVGYQVLLQRKARRPHARLAPDSLGGLPASAGHGQIAAAGPAGLHVSGETVSET